MSENIPAGISKIFEETEQGTQRSYRRRTPVIGITANQKEDTSRVANHYVKSVINAGGIPLVIPQCSDLSLLGETIEHIDALLLTGGGDISPELLGQETIPQIDCVDEGRDREETALVRMAMQRQMPILGICRGHQVLNAACGGTNYRDIPLEHPAPVLEHSQKAPRNTPTHTVKITRGSLLWRILGTEEIAVNTFHHQGVSTVAPGFVQTAVADDGINEAIENPPYPILGVQWHPEPMAAEGDEKMLALFRWLTEEAAVYSRAREFHRRELSLDSHCDTPMLFGQKIDIGVRDDRCKVDIPKLRDGKIDAECMVAYIPQRGRDEEETAAAVAMCASITEELAAQIARNSNKAVQVRNRKEAESAKASGKKGIFFGIENGYGIGHDITLLEKYRDKGIIYMTLCHNGDNDICDSAKGNDEHRGLSNFGREVVREMNRLGIMIDVSHASDATFADVLNESRMPFIASHSSCRALCRHKRNLTDAQIKALAEKGGVVQICIYDDFLADDGNADVRTIADHIDHVVETAGVDYVGIGSDLDGGGGVPGCNAANELINITCELIRRGYTDGDLKKIWGGNFLRVMEQVQQTDKTDK